MSDLSLLARLGLGLANVAASKDRKLLAAGQFDEAQAGFAQLCAGPHSDLATLTALAKNATNAEEFALASRRWSAVCKAFPDNELCHRQAVLSLLKEQRIQEAQDVFQASSPGFSNPTFQSLEARILEAQECFGEALRIWERLATRNPRNAHLQLGVARCLAHTGDYAKAEAHLLAMQGQGVGTRLDIATVLARTASLARDFRGARERWQALAQTYTNDKNCQVGFAAALLADMDIEAAKAHLEAVRARWPDSALAHQIQTTILLADNEVERALELADQLLDQARRAKRPVQFLSTIMKRRAGLLRRLHQNTGDRAYLVQELQALQDARALKHSDLELDRRCLLTALALDKLEEARARQRQLPDSLHSSLADLRMWAMVQDQDLDGARALWRQCKQRHYLPKVTPCEPGVLLRKDDRDIPQVPDEIRLFTAIRNEAWRLPWFLSYYRSIGVDRFFFIDNASSDGSLDYLLEQPDVHVFWTEQSYAVAHSAMRWINHLAQDYGRDGWVLYVDVDEALVYPGVESQDLRHLTGYMARHDQEALPGFMLDMFRNAPPPVNQSSEPLDFVADYSLFDADISRHTLAFCPYYYARGGARQAFGWGETLTKTPLIRGGRDIDFLMSSHRISPARLSDVSAALLHYKLAGDFRKRFDEDLNNNTRVPLCQQRHRHYQRFLERQDAPAGSTPAPNLEAQRYEGSAQLQRLGLIDAPARFFSAERRANLDVTTP